MKKLAFALPILFVCVLLAALTAEAVESTTIVSGLDRAIDGHNYIHWSGYNKSITIMTGCPPCQR